MSTETAAATKSRSRPTKVSREKSTQKRQTILDAAAKVFSDRGYASVRLEDIALEAGTQSGAMYYYFSSKEDLVEEVLKASLGPTIDHLREAMVQLPAETSFQERLTVALRVQLARSLRRTHYTLAFMKIYDQVPESVRTRFAAYPRAYSRFWGELLERAHATGELRPDISLAVMRNALLGCIIRVVEWYRPGTLSPAEIADQVASIFFHGILSDSSGIRLSPATASVVALFDGVSPEAVSALGAGLRAFVQESMRVEDAKHQ